jgi:RNA polymerase sigma factor (sigma-70 family)
MGKKPDFTRTVPMATRTATKVVEHIRSLATAHGGTPLTDSQLLERFVARHEEDAFAALVRRHGPMVLRFCRRLLFNEQDAEDVFQAIFLTLARKAGSIRKHESVASWLHGVAHRLALKARTSAWKRRAHPTPPMTREPADPLAELTGRELCAVLDEELRRLPEKYRAPLLLCYLEGQTQDEAARRLGCPFGTLRSRLERGRELLRVRLVRRGLAVSAVLPAAALAPGTASALPPLLAAATVKASLRFLSGSSAGVASARAVGLAEEACRAATAAKIKLGTVLLLAAGVLLGGSVLAARLPGSPSGDRSRAGTPAPQPQAKAAAKAAPPRRVDLYGDPLPPGALARLGTTRFRAGIQLYAVAFTPDGKKLAAAGAGRPPCLYDLATGKVLHQFGKQRHVLCIAISPDGKTLAVGDNSVRLYSLATGKQVGELKDANGMGGIALVVAFSPDGKTLASGARDQTVRLWDVARSRELRRCVGHSGPIWSLAFAPDGKTLTSGSFDRTVRLWDPATGTMRHVLAGHQDLVLSVAFTRDGKTLASAGGDGTVRLWDSATGRLLRILKGHGGKIHAVALSPDRKVLASAGNDRTIRLWRTATGKEIRRLTDGIDWTVNAVAFSPDGKTLASGSVWDSSIHFWDVASGKPWRCFGGHTGTVTALAFSPDGRSLTSGGRDRWLRSWNVGTGRENRRVRRAHDEVLNPVAFSPDGKIFAAGGFRDHSVRLFDLATGKELRSLGKHPPGARAVAFSPDGKVVASGGVDRVIRLSDTATGKVLHVLRGHRGWVVNLTFSPDGKTLASGVTRYAPVVDDHAIRFWDVATGKEIRGLETDAGDVLAFSPDGKVLASGNMPENTVRLWQVATGKQLARVYRDPRPRVSYIDSLAFSPDGRALASGWEDNRVVLWEVATGKEIRRLRGHESAVWSIRFSPDGRALATGSADSSILIWDLTGHIRDGRLGRVRLSPHELSARWSDLANPDPPKADRAVWDLVAATGQSIPFLQQRLRPAASVAPRQVAPLIADLDSARFAVRRKAAHALERLGDRAEAALRNRLAANPPLETRRRIEQLLRQMNVMNGERLRAVRALTVLERDGGPGARKMLAELARGEPGMWLTRVAAEILNRCRLRHSPNSR